MLKRVVGSGVQCAIRSVLFKLHIARLTLVVVVNVVVVKTGNLARRVIGREATSRQ